MTSEEFIEETKRSLQWLDDFPHTYNKFKKGDKVCFKTHPDVYIGSIASDDIFEFMNRKKYMIFVSDEYFKHFSPYGGTNSMQVDEDSIMLFEK